VDVPAVPCGWAPVVALGLVVAMAVATTDDPPLQARAGISQNSRNKKYHERFFICKLL
jgi:hypothetical protein